MGLVDSDGDMDSNDEGLEHGGEEEVRVVGEKFKDGEGWESSPKYDDGPCLVDQDVSEALLVGHGVLYPKGMMSCDVDGVLPAEGVGDNEGVMVDGATADWPEALGVGRHEGVVECVDGLPDRLGGKEHLGEVGVAGPWLHGLGVVGHDGIVEIGGGLLDVPVVEEHGGVADSAGDWSYGLGVGEYEAAVDIVG